MDKLEDVAKHMWDWSENCKHWSDNTYIPVNWADVKNPERRLFIDLANIAEVRLSVSNRS